MTDEVHVMEEEKNSGENLNESETGLTQGSNEDSVPEPEDVLDLDDFPQEEISLGFKTDPAARIFIPIKKKRAGKRRVHFGATSLGRRHAKNKKLGRCLYTHPKVFIVAAICGIFYTRDVKCVIFSFGILEFLT